MTEGKRKRLTTVEAVAGALELTKEFIGERIDDFKEECFRHIERIDATLVSHGEEIGENAKQIESLVTIVKNGNNSHSRWKNGLKRPIVIGGGTGAMAIAIIYGVLELAGVL